jgi:anthranilate synthase component 2
MFLLIDNYDSFTYNLFHYLGEIGIEVDVRRNDALSVGEAMAMQPQAIVLSPGPCDPDRAGICVDLIRSAAGRVPLLGVCLGHQSIGQAFGGRVVRAPQPMHGKTSVITHIGTDIFEGLPSPLTGNRYHSLMVAREALPDCLVVTAESEDGVVQGLAHRELPIYGVQFHPESIATEHGHALLRNFSAIAMAGMTAEEAQA